MSLQKKRPSMSSLKTANLEQVKKLRRRGGEMSQTWHEEVYHAVHSCQAASLSLTAVHLRGPFWACQVESEKTAWFFAAHSPNRARLLPDVELGCTLSMRPLSLLKSGRLVRSPVEPHGEDDTYPDIS